MITKLNAKPTPTKPQVAKSRCNNCQFGRNIDWDTMKQHLIDGGMKAVTVGDMAGMYNTLGGSVKCVKHNTRVPKDDYCPSYTKRDDEGVPMWPESYEDVRLTFPKLLKAEA